MESTGYPTDLSDDEWHCISPHLPEHACRGRPRLHGLRPILDAVFYVLKSDCPWRMLPREPRRWVVERTFAWISHNRRMAKDYERLCATGEAFLYAAMTRLMVRRLARA